MSDQDLSKGPQCCDLQSQPHPSKGSQGNESSTVDSNRTQTANGIKSKLILPFRLSSFQSVKETTSNSATSVYKLSLGKKPSAVGARGAYKLVHPWVYGSTYEPSLYKLLHIYPLRVTCKGNSAFILFYFWSMLSFCNLKQR